MTDEEAEVLRRALLTIPDAIDLVVRRMDEERQEEQAIRRGQRALPDAMSEVVA